MPYQLGLGDLIDRFVVVNNKMWHLESGLRAGSSGNDITDEEAGKIAKGIRELNRERVLLRNALNEMTGSFQDIKIEHRSAV